LEKNINGNQIISTNKTMQGKKIEGISTSQEFSGRREFQGKRLQD
jgi:hypothetical protein